MRPLPLLSGVAVIAPAVLMRVIVAGFTVIMANGKHARPFLRPDHMYRTIEAWIERVDDTQNLDRLLGILHWCSEQ